MKAIIQTISKIIDYIACRFHNGKQSINHTLKCLFIHFITFLFVTWLGVISGMNLEIFKLKLKWDYFNYVIGAFLALVILYLILHIYKFLLVKFYFNEDISHKWTINLLDFIYTFLSVVAIAYFLGIKESGYDVFITYLINKYRDNSISPKDYKLIAEYIKPYFDVVITYIAASISCTAIITTKLNNQYNKYFQSKHS
ncbi:hypothetical protein [Holdemanella biformis]